MARAICVSSGFDRVAPVIELLNRSTHWDRSRGGITRRLRPLHLVPIYEIPVDQIVVSIKIELFPRRAIHHGLTIHGDMISVDRSGQRNILDLSLIIL